MKSSNRTLWRKITGSPITTGVLIVVAMFLIRSAWNMYTKARGTVEALQFAQDKQADMLKREQELSGLVTSLSTEQGIEAEIRTRYRAVRDGEKVSVIVDDQAQVATASLADTVDPTTGDGWFARLLHRLGL